MKPEALKAAKTMFLESAYIDFETMADEVDQGNVIGQTIYGPMTRKFTLILLWIKANALAAALLTLQQLWKEIITKNTINF